MSPPPFFRHEIPKKNSSRGVRVAWEPLALKVEYKALARKLDSFFRSYLPLYPNNDSYGFVRGRNIRENASVHCGKTFLLSMDIKDFFPSITRGRIEGLFVELGLSTESAALLSRFLTIGGSLPLGLPTSPCISNAIALPLDIELSKLSSNQGSAYTRYVDDMSFSSNHRLLENSEVERAIWRNGFAVAFEKTSVSKIGQAHFVTSLSVSDSVSPHIPGKIKAKLRQQIYYAKKFGLIDHFQRRGINSMQQEVNRLDGLVKYVSYHELRMRNGLRSDWRNILIESNMRASFTPKMQDRSPHSIYIDEAEFRSDGHVYLAIGMALTQNADQIFAESAEVLASAIADPYAAGNIKQVEKRGLHFADASEDLRLAYVRRLAKMPFSGYIAFCVNNDPDKYEEIYLRLLGSLIKRRLMSAESRFAFIYCEKNDKVRRSAVEACVEKSFSDLKERNNRRPEAYGIEFVGKPNLGVSVPDFLLGVLGKYLNSQPAAFGQPEPRDRLMFEQLRDKYRTILDLSAWVEYTRRNPIEPWCP